MQYMHACIHACIFVHPFINKYDKVNWKMKMEVQVEIGWTKGMYLSNIATIIFMVVYVSFVEIYFILA